MIKPNLLKKYKILNKCCKTAGKIHPVQLRFSKVVMNVMYLINVHIGSAHWKEKKIFVLSLEVSEHTLNISLIKDNEYYGGVEGPDEKNNKLTCSDELGFVR